MPEMKSDQIKRMICQLGFVLILELTITAAS